MNYPTPKKLNLQQCPEYHFIPEYKHSLELETPIRKPIIIHHVGIRGVGKTQQMLSAIGGHPHIELDIQSGQIIVRAPSAGIVTYNFGPFKPENIFQKIKRKFRNIRRWIMVKRMIRDLSKQLV